MAILFGASMFLNWVGVVTPGGSYVIANGLHQANWMLVAAGIVVALAVRLALAPPTAYIRFAFLVLDFLVSLGLYIEYIDNVGRAEADTVQAYVGAGFYVALGATALLIVSTVLGWRARDEWPDLADRA